MAPLKCYGNGPQNTVNKITLKKCTHNLNNLSTEKRLMIIFSLQKQKGNSQQRIKALK